MCRLPLIQFYLLLGSHAYGPKIKFNNTVDGLKMSFPVNRRIL